jgi:hypothetical protein
LLFQDRSRVRTPSTKLDFNQTRRQLKVKHEIQSAYREIRVTLFTIVKLWKAPLGVIFEYEDIKKQRLAAATVFFVAGISCSQRYLADRLWDETAFFFF